MQKMQPSFHRPVALWLFACCIMITLMVLVGGLTRLTESGLSMTDWKPVTGWFPPTSEEAWLSELNKYRQSPEYKHKNFGMTVEEFQNIFWLEYIHRVFGRLTGLVFFIPFVYFLFKKRLDKPLILKLSGVLLLGATQGLVGWLMVKSGLKDNPFVSPVWLSTHLGVAFFIFSIILWQALNVWHGVKIRFSSPSFLQKFAWVVLLAVYLQILLGGMVAGSDAGLAYNTWPDMNGKIIPEGLAIMQPWYANPLQNVTMIQFNHRLGAYIVSILVAVFAMLLLRKGQGALHRLAIGLFSVLSLQMVLGIKTLLYSVPVGLASTHQMVALLLFFIAILTLHRLYNPATQNS